MSDESRIDEFERAALPHLNDLFRAAARIIGDRAEASDLVQEAYLQAWKSFHRFEIGTNCRAWLYKILFNVIHHHRRRLHRFNMKMVRDDDPGIEETLRYEAPLPEELVDAEVLAAFEKLPVHYREVVMLVDVREFSYKEAADATGVPIGTVMSRLSRGRRLLRAELAQCAKAYGIGSDRQQPVEYVPVLE